MAIVPVGSIVAALPWIAAPLVVAWRMRGGPALDDYSPAPPPDPPLVSVIVPARDEARNIGRCMASVLGATWPRLELLVVDDHSRDETRAIATALAARDPRVRVLEAPPLPEGWFGKQWACWTGARAARGSILLFTDADTEHGTELVARSVNAMRADAAAMFSVAGRQELGTFWERVVQPQVFLMLAARYGAPRRVNRSPRAEDKIANGQCLFFTREAYDAIGGHESVRHKVAEDLALAQRAFARGVRTEVVLGVNELSTRMYTSLGELARGWMKNIFAGAVDAVPMGPVGRALLPVALFAGPLLTLLPPLTLLAALVLPMSHAAVVWAVVATAVSLVWWAVVYAKGAGLSPLWALAYPLGAAVLAYIIIQAVSRGRRVEWKGRAYRAA